MSKKPLAALVSAATAIAGYSTIAAPVASAQTTGTITVNCASNAAGRKPISPLIYGQNYQFFNDPWLTGNSALALDYDARFTWGITARRFGGDASTRYNWRVGNAQNGGFNNDFVNGNAVYNGNAGAKVWQHFLEENRLKGLDTTYSVPMLGWVAKDTTSGTPRTGPLNGPFGPYYVPQNVPQTTTSVSSGTTDVSDFITAVKADPVSVGGRQAITTYILDNEVDIWASTHEDVAKGLNRTNPAQKGISAAEWIERTKEYSAVIRAKDPAALIAGPAVSGPGGMMFSSADKALWPRTDRGESTAGGFPTPEYTARGNVPFLKHYLQALKAYDADNNKKSLDIVDVHFYAPFGGADGQTYNGALYSQGTGPIVSAKRIESTQALWKSGYKSDMAPASPGEAELSFGITPGDPGDARILTRLNELVAPGGAYPGLKTSLGEYNFGGAQYMSGALAQAEALGRFGQHGLYSAYYWESSAAERNFPMERIPVGFAFRAYRNYDGAGSKFQDISLPVTNPLDGAVSVFGSTSTAGDKVVMVALNLSPTAAASPTITLSGCAAPGTTAKVYRYNAPETTGGLSADFGASAWTPTNRPAAFTNAGTIPVSGGSVTPTLPPYSINVIELSGTTTPNPTTNTALPAITGTATVGQTLTATPGTWTGSPTSYAYVWQRCDSSGNACVAIAGATTPSYVLNSADVGKTLRVVVTATTTAGSGTASSAASALVNPVSTSSENVFASGAYGPQWSSYSSSGAGGVITAGNLVFNLPASTSQFISFGRSTNITSAPSALEFKVKTTASTLSINAFANGTSISGNVINLPAPAADGYRTVSRPWSSLFANAPSTFGAFYLNPSGTAAQSVEFQYLRFGTGTTVSAPVNTTAPTVAGTKAVGQTLTTNNGVWTNAPTNYAYIWQRCNAAGGACVAIAGATLPTYVLLAADKGATIRSVVTASNAAGAGQATPSVQTEVIRSIDVVFGAGAFGPGWGTNSSNGTGGTITAGILTFNLTANANQFISIGKSAPTLNPVTLEFKVKTTSPTLSVNAFNGPTFIPGKVITLPAAVADGYRTVSVAWSTLFTSPPASITNFYLNPAGADAKTVQFSSIQFLK
jgi:hypothetical protein